MTIKNYNPSQVAICFDHFKDAALYFDRVLPFNFMRMRGYKEINDMLIGYPEEVPSRILSHLIDGIEVQNNTYTHADRIMEITISFGMISLLALYLMQIFLIKTN